MSGTPTGTASSVSMAVERSPECDHNGDVPGDADRVSRAAERFDGIYTEMTILQRRLIAASRDGTDLDGNVSELLDRAHTVTAAVETALRALALGRPSPVEVEAAALRARVLAPPVDGLLVSLALKAIGRTHAYPLLADALRAAAAANGLDGAFGNTLLIELLAAPRSVGNQLATQMLDTLALAHDQRVADLAGDELTRVSGAIEAAGIQLPHGVGYRRAARTGPQPDGSGGGQAVLSSWVDAIGAPTDTPRTAALEAARRDGWPSDAVPVAELLLRFTECELAPLVIPDWDRLAAIDDFDDRRASLREQERAFRATREEDGWVRALLLKHLINAMTAAHKARRLVDGPANAWGSSTPLALSRTVGRRCGEWLSVFEPDDVEPLLAALPAAADEAPSG